MSEQTPNQHSEPTPGPHEPPQPQDLTAAAPQAEPPATYTGHTAVPLVGADPPQGSTYHFPTPGTRQAARELPPVPHHGYQPPQPPPWGNAPAAPFPAPAGKRPGVNRALLASLIAGGLVLVIGATVAITGFVARLVDREADWNSFRDITATASPSPSSLFKQIKLDETYNFPARPSWEVHPMDGWEWTIKDEGGINKITEKATGCEYSTMQNLIDAETATTMPVTDSEASKLTMDALIGQMFEKVPTAKMGPDPAATKGFTDLTGKDIKVLDFLTKRIDYKRPDNGDAFTSIYAVRTFPSERVELAALLSCPTSVIDSSTSKAWKSVAELSTYIGRDLI